MQRNRKILVAIMSFYVCRGDLYAMQEFSAESYNQEQGEEEESDVVILNNPVYNSYSSVGGFQKLKISLLNYCNRRTKNQTEHVPERSSDDETFLEPDEDTRCCAFLRKNKHTEPKNSMYEQ